MSDEPLLPVSSLQAHTTDALHGYQSLCRLQADLIAALRARVEAVDFTSRRLGTATADPWTEGWNKALEVCQADLRAALDGEGTP